MADHTISLEAYTLSNPCKIGSDFTRELEITNNGTKFYPGGHLTVVADNYFNVSSASVPSIAPGQSIRVQMPIKVKGMKTVDDLPETITYKLDGRDYVNTNHMDDFMAGLKEFTPGVSCGAEKLNILLFGLAGSGKSSFINSALTLTSNDYTKLEDQAQAGGQTGHVTRTLVRYPFELKGRPLPFHLWDTWGLTKDTYTGEELELILDGKLPSKWEMSKEIHSRESQAQLIQGESTAYTRRIHGVLFLFPQAALNDPNLNSVRQLLRKNFEKVSSMGYNPFLVLTKVDEYSAKFRQNPNPNVHPELDALKTKAAQLLNIAPNKVLFNINYYTETQRQFRIDKLTFKILETALNGARAKSRTMSYSNSSGNPEYEW